MSSGLLSLANRSRLSAGHRPSFTGGVNGLHLTRMSPLLTRRLEPLRKLSWVAACDTSTVADLSQSRAPTVRTRSLRTGCYVRNGPTAPTARISRSQADHAIPLPRSGPAKVVYHPREVPDVSYRPCPPTIKTQAYPWPGNPPGFPVWKFSAGHSGTNFPGIITTG